MRVFDYHWKSNPAWYHRNEYGIAVLNDDAPEEAKKSYQHFLEQSRYAEQRVKEGKSLD